MLKTIHFSYLAYILFLIFTGSPSVAQEIGLPKQFENIEGIKRIIVKNEIHTPSPILLPQKNDTSKIYILNKSGQIDSIITFLSAHLNKKIETYHYKNNQLVKINTSFYGQNEVQEEDITSTSYETFQYKNRLLAEHLKYDCIETSSPYQRTLYNYDELGKLASTIAYYFPYNCTGTTFYVPIDSLFKVYEGDSISIISYKNGISNAYQSLYQTNQQGQLIKSYSTSPDNEHYEGQEHRYNANGYLVESKFTSSMLHNSEMTSSIANLILYDYDKYNRLIAVSYYAKEILLHQETYHYLY